MNWLKQLSPDVISIIVTTIGGALVWGYHKIKGDKVDSIGSLLDDIIGNLAHEWLDKWSNQDIATYIGDARDTIEKQIWDIASKRGIPKNSLTESLVHAAIEKGTLWLANRIAERKMPGQIADLDARAKAILKIFESMPELKPVDTTNDPATKGE